MQCNLVCRNGTRKEGGHKPPSLLFVSGVVVVKKPLLLLLLFVVLVGSAAGAPPRAAAPAPYVGQCGIPATQPVWFEFGQPYLQPVFGKPGVVVGTSTGDWPAQMRALGAGTVYFDLNLQEPRRHADEADRHRDDGRPRAEALHVRRAADRLLDSGRRLQRALRSRAS